MDLLFCIKITVMMNCVTEEWSPPWECHALSSCTLLWERRARLKYSLTLGKVSCWWTFL